MAIKLGLDAKLFRGVAGTQGTIEVTNVKDVSLSLESGEADVTTRKAKGWKLSVATLKEASLEITTPGPEGTVPAARAPRAQVSPPRRTHRRTRGRIRLAA